MPRPRVTSQLTTSQMAKQLGMSVGRVISWVERGALPPPSFIDNNGVRYFDQEWLRRARAASFSEQTGRWRLSVEACSGDKSVTREYEIYHRLEI
ncbi:hypothetical protein ES705_33552 [subsurface metagenome]